MCAGVGSEELKVHWCRCGQSRAILVHVGGDCSGAYVQVQAVNSYSGAFGQ